jgi:hypothetical protein
VAALAACDTWNPAQISRRRHPEYYGGAAEPQPRTEQASRRADAPPPEAPPVAASFEELPGETLVVEESAAPDQPGNPLAIATLRAAGAVRIDTNDPIFTTRLDAILDGSTGTLSRSEEVNPLILVFHFEPPVRLAAVRIFPSYSTSDWAVRAQPEQPRFLIREAADEQWSRMDLPEPVETAEVRLEVRRLLRDDYVHVNEVELLIEP